MGKGCLSAVPDVFARPGLGDGPGLTAFVPGGDSLRPLTFVGRTVLFGTTQKPRSPAGLWKRKTRSEEHTSELQSLMSNSYAVFCLKKKKTKQPQSQLERRKRSNNKHTNITKLN